MVPGTVLWILGTVLTTTVQVTHGTSFLYPGSEIDNLHRRMCLHNKKHRKCCPTPKKRTSLKQLLQEDERGSYISKIDWRLMEKKTEE